MNVIDDNPYEATETVIVNVGAATGGHYTVATGAGTTTVSITDNDGNGNGNGDGNGGTPTQARPAFSGAQVIGNQILLFGPNGKVKATVPVTPGTPG